eukprot:TRINITY_DN2750_c0_g1_i1.p1 TRINITY_DN2750_c0_g1~~TRINITY_DN2750_c0_g1_i1.p1  ORF type:complete len:132 (-),score=24.41 TRINITY_DN2750_c0_g1_i1:25-420(-)
MVVYSVYIVNKAGGLIFHEDYAAGQKWGGNDYLRLASTFHGIHTITTQLSPTGHSSGIEVIEAETFRLQCLQTPTGIKFYVVADPNHQIDALMNQVYETYTDYVLKNPFYEIEMPIHCELFYNNMKKLLKQ